MASVPLHPQYLPDHLSGRPFKILCVLRGMTDVRDSTGKENDESLNTPSSFKIYFSLYIASKGKNKLNQQRSINI